MEYYIELAKQEGGQILCGGKRPEGLTEPFTKGAFLEPTVVTGLDYKAKTSTEEIFGPITCVYRFKTEEQVIEMANIVNYGLCSSVVTNNLTVAHRMSEQLEVGMVWVNTWLLRDLRVPFRGAKESGVGTEGGKYSLEFYSEDKNVCIKL